MDNFGIQIHDGSTYLPPFVVDENTKTMQLYDWQRRAINYFFKHDCQSIFECATGCLTGDTLIDLPRDLKKYPNGIPIKKLVGKKYFYTYTFNIETQCLELKKVKKVWLNKKSADVYEITTMNGKKIKATKNHPFLVDIKEKINGGHGANKKLVGRKYCNVENLKVGDYVTTFNRTRTKYDYGEIIKTNYAPHSRRVLEHRFIIEQLDGKILVGNCVHHKDHNRFNNVSENLEQINNREHNSYHTKKRGFFGKALWEKNGHPKGMKGKKHSEETKQNISINSKLACNGIKYISKRKDNHNKEFELLGYDLYKTEKYIMRGKKQMQQTINSIEYKKKKKNIYRTDYSERIIKIEYCGKEDVYDMNVEDNHNFIANGFIVHNSGKTRVALELIKKVWETDPECKVLIVVPKNIILETGWYSELYNFGVSLRDIGVYYGKIKEYAKVTITNMQNIDRIAVELFDFVIWDEVHNYGTHRLLPYVARKVKYKLGLSATLERMDDAHYDLLEIFNYNKFEYAPAEALEDGVLNPFNFYNISIDVDGLERDRYELLTQQINAILVAGGGFKKIMFSRTSGLKFSLLSKMTARKMLVNNYYKKVDVVKQIVNKHKKDKIILFGEYNKQTSKFYWHLLEEGVKACVVHSNMPMDKREENIIGFKNDKYNVVLASKVLDEGVNIPKIDVAIISAGNSTSRQTIQRMGRVLRRKKHHSNLYQIYCTDTIEEKYAFTRAKLFKDLCHDYKSYHYKEEALAL